MADESKGAINVSGPAHLAPKPAPGLAFDERGVLCQIGRESVEDALLIVESYGPWGTDLNAAHRLQIVLADEVKRLRASLRPDFPSGGTGSGGLTQCDMHEDEST